MPDCAQCNRPLGARLRRCKACGACEHCCECETVTAFFDADELGLDPEASGEVKALRAEADRLGFDLIPEEDGA